MTDTHDALTQAIFASVVHTLRWLEALHSARIALERMQ